MGVVKFLLNYEQSNEVFESFIDIASFNCLSFNLEVVQYCDKEMGPKAVIKKCDFKVFVEL